MPLPVAVVDAFSSTPFAGNPAAVVVLSHSAPEAWMQAVAAELNLAETAFVRPDGAGGWHLRWFTPAVEVELCGHATLAAAHHLWESGLLPPDGPAVFDTHSGTLTAVRAGGGVVELDFPAVSVTPCDPPAGLSDALGVPVTAAGEAGDDLLVELADEAMVRVVEPDFAALAGMADRGVVVTAAPAADADFVSRGFFPAVGIPEDPVTGSAHCALGPYWAARLGRAELLGFQASKRGGFVRVTVRGGRVTLAGPAVTAWRGELLHGPA